MGSETGMVLIKKLHGEDTLNIKIIHILKRSERGDSLAIEIERQQPLSLR